MWHYAAVYDTENAFWSVKEIYPRPNKDPDTVDLSAVPQGDSIEELIEDLEHMLTDIKKHPSYTETRLGLKEHSRDHIN